MKLIIVRHAETIANREGMAEGQLQGELSDLGKKQSEKLAERLMKKHIDVVYCSDLKRCKDTIQPLLNKVNIPIHYAKELRERSYGIFEGRPTVENQKWAKENASEDPKEYPNIRMPGGESFNDVMLRARKFFDEVISKEKGTVLIVTHSGTKRALIISLMNKVGDSEFYNKLTSRSANAGFSVLEINDGENPKIFEIFSVEHLEGLDER